MLQYSDTSAYNGIIQAEERLVYSGDYGRISGNTKELAHWTVRNNQALSRVAILMMKYQDAWQFDDWNNTGVSTATENIASGTREVALTNPQDVLFITKVMIKQDTTTTDWTLLRPIDIRSQDAIRLIENSPTNVGIPTRYEKNGKYIILDPTPNYTVTAGLKYYYQRSPHLFVVGDTTAVAGIPSLFDQLIPLYATDMYATENTNPTLKALVNNDIVRMEADLKAFMSLRSQDVEPRMMAKRRPVR
jgi:hypothetical protein